MAMNAAALIRFELKALYCSRATVLALSAFMLAGLGALAIGRAAVDQQQHAIEAAERHQRAELRDFAQRRAGGEAGLVAYDLVRSAVHRPSPWAAVAWGQRDVEPVILPIRLLGIESQLYAGEDTNPDALASGVFDLSFVLALLLPLLAMALMHDSVALDKELGLEALVHVSARSGSTHLLLRMCVRAAAAFGAVACLVTGAIVIAGLPLDGRLGAWVALVLAYTCAWLALCAAAAALTRQSVSAALVVLGLWSTTALLLPAIANRALDHWAPKPRTFELALNQRNVVHDGWDLPREHALDAMRQRRPDWARERIATDAFSWPWYYANWEAGDRSVAPLAAEYRDRIAARERAAVQIGLFLPPAGFSIAMSQIAQTDMRSRLAFLQSVRAFHESLKQFFYPRLFGAGRIEASDFERVPAHTFAPAPPAPPLAQIAALVVVTFLASTMVLLGLRRAARRQA